MNNRTTNDQGVSLERITLDTVGAYNAGGPPERANLTHDGKPVPSLEAMGPSVQHKWACASSAAARAGAEYIIGLVAVGQHDPVKLRAAMQRVLAAPVWVPTIRYDAEVLAKGYEEKTADGRALAMGLRELAGLVGVGAEASGFIFVALRALTEPREEPSTSRDPAAKEKAAARLATLTEWRDAWPTKEELPLAGAAAVWRNIVTGLQALHDRAPADARARYAAMISTYRAEAEHLEHLLT